MLTNSMIERINSVVQGRCGPRGRGYRSTENFIAIAYLVCETHNFKLTARSSEES